MARHCDRLRFTTSVSLGGKCTRGWLEMALPRRLQSLLPARLSTWFAMQYIAHLPGNRTYIHTYLFHCCSAVFPVYVPSKPAGLETSTALVCKYSMHSTNSGRSEPGFQICTYLGCCFPQSRPTRGGDFQLEKSFRPDCAATFPFLCSLSSPRPPSRYCLPGLLFALLPGLLYWPRAEEDGDVGTIRAGGAYQPHGAIHDAWR
jgi:hypothetical protein